MTDLFRKRDALVPKGISSCNCSDVSKQFGHFHRCSIWRIHQKRTNLKAFLANFKIVSG